MVIADDSPLYRRGIARAVAAEPAMRLVGAVDGGETAVRAVETLEPDRLLADHPTRKVLLSSSLDADVERRARAAGVSACLPKHMSCGDICAAALALVRRQGRRLRSRRRVAEAMRRGLLD